MKYSDSEKRYDACYYVIGKSEKNIKHGAGNILIQFTAIDNIVISLHQGDNATTTSAKSIIEKNTEVTVGKTYYLKNTESMIVSAHVKNKDTPSNLGFQYWTDAPEGNLY